MQKMSAECNLYSYIHTCMKTLPCLKKTAFGSSVNWHLGKIKPCCYFCDFNLPYILQLLQVVNCSTLSCKLEIVIMKLKTARAISELLNGSMKIIQVDIQKAKDHTKNKIKGCPRVERGNISPFSFC